jgi:hypothetical protein
MDTMFLFLLTLQLLYFTANGFVNTPAASKCLQYAGMNRPCFRGDSLLTLSSTPSDNTYGPPCIIVAGLPEKHLETMDDIFSAALGVLPPVIILSQKDIDSKITLKELLNDREARDHAMSGKLCSLDSPVIIFAGCDRTGVRLSIRSYKSWDPPQSGSLPKTAFAVVVENSVTKTIGGLCDQILNDFRAEQSRKDA